MLNSFLIKIDKKGMIFINPKKISAIVVGNNGSIVIFIGANKFNLKGNNLSESGLNLIEKYTGYIYKDGEFINDTITQERNQAAIDEFDKIISKIFND